MLSLPLFTANVRFDHPQHPFLCCAGFVGLLHSVVCESGHRRGGAKERDVTYVTCVTYVNTVYTNLRRKFSTERRECGTGSFKGRGGVSGGAIYSLTTHATSCRILGDVEGALAFLVLKLCGAQKCASAHTPSISPLFNLLFIVSLPCYGVPLLVLPRFSSCPSRRGERTDRAPFWTLKYVSTERKAPCGFFCSMR